MVKSPGLPELMMEVLPDLFTVTSQSSSDLRWMWSSLTTAAQDFAHKLKLLMMSSQLLQLNKKQSFHKNHPIFCDVNQTVQQIYGKLTAQTQQIRG